MGARACAGIASDDLEQARTTGAFTMPEPASLNGRSMSDETYVVNVEAAIFHGDKWLMILRSAEEAHAAGTLSFVGGKVERAGITDNILEDTLRREIAEEVGVTVDQTMRYVESKSFIAADGLPVIDIVFLC